MTRVIWSAFVLPFLLGCSVAGAQPPSPVSSTTSQCHYRDQLPDPDCTPGSVDPRVTQENIDSTICTSGYTDRVRPTVRYTNDLKIRQMIEYGVSGPLSNFEEDHVVSLELGGNPTDPKNLFPEPIDSARKKDQVENKLHRMVCAGQISLVEAQRRIATDWTTATIL